MSTLFIANTTKQHHTFIFFIPGPHDVWKEEFSGQTLVSRRFVQYGSTPKMLNIPAGGQIVINDVDDSQIKGIVDQHTRYGMKSIRELESGERPPLVYNVNSPVQLVYIEEGIKLRDEYLDERAKIIREEGAAAAAKTIQDSLGAVGVDVARVEVSSVEETKSRDQKPKVSEGFEILNEGVSSRHQGATPSKRGNQNRW